jgi:hypothetical protein
MLRHPLNDTRQKGRIRFIHPFLGKKRKKTSHTPETPICVLERRAEMGVTAIQRRSEAFHPTVESTEEDLEGFFVDRPLESAPPLGTSGKATIPQEEEEQPMVKQSLFMPFHLITFRLLLLLLLLMLFLATKASMQCLELVVMCLINRHGRGLML